MSKEIENLLNSGKIDFEHLRILRAKQSFEAIFIVMVVFSAVITIGDMAFDKNKQKIEDIKTNAQKVLTEQDEYGFDYSINMAGMRAQDAALNKNFKPVKVMKNGNIKVKIERGDTIYTLFAENGIKYSKANINKVKRLNKKKNIRNLKIGDEIILPSEQ